MTDTVSIGELFGAQLRELRKRRALTQVQHAEITGVPQNHISSLERGTMLPTLGTIVRFAVALDCKVTALVPPFDKAELRAMLPK